MSTARDDTPDDSRPLRFKPAAIECPPWCEQPPGHGYRCEPDGAPGLYRVHTRTYAAAQVSAQLAQEERAASPAGPVLREPPRVDLDFPDHPPEQLTSSELRALASALVRCANQLDALDH